MKLLTPLAAGSILPTSTAPFIILILRSVASFLVIVTAELNVNDCPFLITPVWFSVALLRIGATKLDTIISSVTSKGVPTTLLTL